MCLPFLITFRLAARAGGAPNLLADWRKVLWVYDFPSENQATITPRMMDTRWPRETRPSRWSGTGLWRNFLLTLETSIETYSPPKCFLLPLPASRCR